MFFRSIRSSIAAFTSVAIILACGAVLIASTGAHERLYLESVEKDLDGLSSNLAVDLVPILSADEPDTFEMTTAMLRLDRYENVKFAAILDASKNVVDVYSGKAFSSREDMQNKLAPDSLATLSHGVSVMNGELIAFKHIGEVSLPQGYLFIVNDSLAPLAKSKRTLLYQVLPLVMLTIALSIILSLWQNHRLLSPLRKLADLAKEIKRTSDYSIDFRIPGKREVRDLSIEISSMMKTIHSASSKNKAYTAQLTEQQKTMEHMANFDSLTSLPNRANFLRMIEDSLAQAKSKERSPILMYCDLDGFKSVNDIHGHEIGDNLLIAVSKRLGHYLRDDDIVSRIGGDEFLILLPDEPSLDRINEVAQRIVKGLSEPFVIQGWELNISVSIGISGAVDADFDKDNLIAFADLAMYRAKQKGKNTFSIFESGMMEANTRRLAIANAIPHAIKHDEFVLHYQAKVNGNEQVVGFEALIRWNSEELGFVSPVEFISIAEQSGKIGLITKWVINQVSEDLSTLKQLYGEEIVVALNLSASDLKDEDLLNVIRKAFREHNVKPSCIEFEVTESAFLDNFEQANIFFDNLALLGCSVALDDFGTGYSSLSYLTKMQLNTLKIDKQFIDGVGLSERTSLVTKTIMEMARNLNLKVCAEGVETKEQQKFLQDAICDEYQGYLFAKPKPLEQLRTESAKVVNIR